MEDKRPVAPLLLFSLKAPNAEKNQSSFYHGGYETIYISLISAYNNRLLIARGFIVFF
jgi:hypothetical protein